MTHLLLQWHQKYCSTNSLSPVPLLSTSLYFPSHYFCCDYLYWTGVCNHDGVSGVILCRQAKNPLNHNEFYFPNKFDFSVIESPFLLISMGLYEQTTACFFYGEPVGKRRKCTDDRNQSLWHQHKIHNQQQSEDSSPLMNFTCILDLLICMKQNCCDPPYWSLLSIYHASKQRYNNLNIKQASRQEFNQIAKISLTQRSKIGHQNQLTTKRRWVKQ
jgi:hypothetical protein